MFETFWRLKYSDASKFGKKLDGRVMGSLSFVTFEFRLAGA